MHQVQLIFHSHQMMDLSNLDDLSTLTSIKVMAGNLGQNGTMHIPGWNFPPMKTKSVALSVIIFLLKNVLRKPSLPMDLTHGRSALGNLQRTIS